MLFKIIHFSIEISKLAYFILGIKGTTELKISVHRPFKVILFVSGLNFYSRYMLKFYKSCNNIFDSNSL